MVTDAQFSAAIHRIKTLEDALGCQGQIIRSMCKSIAGHREAINELILVSQTLASKTGEDNENM